MLLRIIRYLKGYLCIRVTGYSPERFLNACRNKGIYIWGLKPVTGSYEMMISIKDFRKIKPMIKKTRTKVTIVRRAGLPFFLHKYRKRKTFFAGAFFCMLLIFLLSRFVWNIDIVGNCTYTDETLLRFLNKLNINNGMLVKDIDCAKIAKEIRKEYDEIIWVSASIQGTRLIIQVKENEDSFSVNNDDREQQKAYDLIADRNCTITDIIVRKGIVQVEKGAEVQKGDILVSGMIPVINDAGEIVEYQFQKSDADITGKMQLHYSDSIPILYQEKKNMEIEKDEYFFSFGNFRISFGGIKNNYENFEENSIQYKLCLTDHFYLPICIGQRNVKPYTIIEKTYTQKELQEILSKRFYYYCEDLEKKGVEILKNDVKIYRESKSAEANGSLTVQLAVGELKTSESKVVLEEKENEQSGELIDGNDGNNH